MILYNSEDRHGADEEADNFKHALETAGCDVIKLQWSNTSELGSMIDSSLTRIVGDCSLLIVAVMTHGYRGALRGSEGSQIPISDLLFQFKQELPQHLPLASEDRYPIKLSYNDTVTLHARQLLENHLTQQLSYNQTDASTLVDEITSLVRENNKSAGGVRDLYNIAADPLETFRQILQFVSSDDERLQVLQMKDSKGWTVLHGAVFNSATETVHVLLESVSEEMRYTLLRMEDNRKWTPIHRACWLGDSEVLEMMMRLITVEMRYKLLQLPDVLECTPLHMSALWGHTQHIRVIADSVRSQQLKHLLRITDGEGRTPLQLAALRNDQDLVELLQDYQTKALIDVALQQTEQSGK